MHNALVRIRALLLLLAVNPSSSFLSKISMRMRSLPTRQFAGPRVWVEEAEDGFVDDEENLEEGEICLKSLKAFAGRGDDEEKVFLCAGALIQRPSEEDSENSLSPQICDAWMADSILEECGPNLQLQGALQVLDELFLFHLEASISSSSSDDHDLREAAAVQALRNFVLHCGTTTDSDCTCASYMASQVRGFVPLKDAVRTTSIYNSQYYDHDLEGVVFDHESGSNAYREAKASSSTARSILATLPEEETVKRFTTKRFTMDL